MGEIEVAEPTAVTFNLQLDDPSPLYSRAQTAIPGTIAATRIAPPRRVPLSEACGEYVDWYRVRP